MRATGPDALEIAGGCGPCCDCDDYARLYDAIRLARVRQVDVANQLKTIVAAYTGIVRKFVEYDNRILVPYTTADMKIQ